MDYYHGGEYGMMGGAGIVGFIIMLAVIVAIIVGVFALMRHTPASPLPAHGTTSKSALDILKDRYAKGEIDKKEYTEKRKDIEI